MMKFILAITLLAAAAMASDDGTSVHGDLIKDYCAADDAGRDAILVALEGWCLQPADKKTKAFCDEIGTSFAETGYDKAVFRQGLADGVC